MTCARADYILAIDGRELTADDNIHARLEGRAGQQVVIEVNDVPERTDTVRTATVIPVSNEFMLRRMAWVEDCRRRVEERSDGRLAYVWLPDTGGGGYTYFNRYYFAQQDREGAVIDERFNSGGYAADYIVDILARPLMGYFNSPLGEHKPFTSPGAGIFGPKVMVINESAGSGGDYLPYMFRKREIGPLVGTRTWGGLVGIWGVPGLIDGGYITAPRGGFFDTDGRWSVENEGVAPDIEVEQTPAAMAAGADPQLDRAIDEALRLLETNPNERVWEQPADPVRAVRPKR